MTPIRALCGYWRLSAVALVGAVVLGCGKEPDAAESAHGPPKRGQIHESRLLRAAEEPQSWFTTGRDFGKTHFSPLQQIDRSNVQRLGFAWEYHTGTNRGLEASPIVVDGVMFTSGQAGKVYALDAATGREIWVFDPRVNGQIYRVTCCDGVNRGVAVRNGSVYVAALDGRLFALNADDGAVRWEVDTIIDATRGYTSTGAPEVAGDVVVIGNAGAEFDARGYISAYSLDSGKLAWRFFTVPGDPKQPYEHPELEWAAKTWDPNSLWQAGLGGTAWDALVYDPELNLLYVGTGNAAVYSQRDRSPSGGDNLFLSSILAINPDTGRLVWHYQEVPGDQWDYTATQPIVLADLTIDGKPRKVLMQAPKNGYFYVLDRETGKLISAANYVPVNWGSIDPITGKATVNKKVADYSDGVKLVFPSSGGGHSWHPMSFNPKTGLVYVAVLEMGNYIFDAAPGHEYRPGVRNIGAQVVFAGGVALGAADYPKEIAATIESKVLLAGQPDPTPRAFLRAWDPIAQRKVWDVEMAGFWDRAGVLSTGAGLVVQGTGTGHLRVYDALDGELLKEIRVGSSIVAAPVTYAVNGEQYIAVMAAIGGAPLSYAPPPGSAAFEFGNMGRILAFKLGGGATPLPRPLPPIGPMPRPPVLAASQESVDHGAKLYAAYCRSCHRNSPRGAAPDLRRTSPDTFRAAVLGGAYRFRGMPQWDDLLSSQDVDAIQAYVISEARAAYAAENDVAAGSSVGTESPEPHRAVNRRRSEALGAGSRSIDKHEE